MTTPVCVRRRIRQLDRQGLSHREISRKLGVSRTTVVKYANHGDCSPKPLGSGHAENGAHHLDTVAHSIELADRPLGAIPILNRHLVKAEVVVQRVDGHLGFDRLSSTYFQENKRPFHNFGNRLVRGSINGLFHANVTDIMTGYRSCGRASCSPGSTWSSVGRRSPCRSLRGLCPPWPARRRRDTYRHRRP